MMNRCLNHIFGYCYSEPQPVQRQETQTIMDYSGRTGLAPITVIKCLNDHRTCSQYLTHSQLCELKTK